MSQTQPANHDAGNEQVNADHQQLPAPEAQIQDTEITDATPATRAPRSLNCLTIAEKDALCKHRSENANLSNTQLKKWAKTSFNKEPSSSQISRILQEPQKWAARDVRAPGARKVRNGKWPHLETALNIVFAQVSLPIKSPVFRSVIDQYDIISTSEAITYRRRRDCP